MTLEELKKQENPWAKLHEPDCTGCYMPLIDNQFNKAKWYYAEKDLPKINDLIRESNGTPDMLLPFFNLDPAPWIGRWNVESDEQLPEIVILSQNPGICDRNFLDVKCESLDKARENGQKYYKLIKRWLEGKATSSEILLDPVWQHYNGTYWLERLNEVLNMEKKELIYNKSYSQKVHDILNKIIFIDLCPYHSLDGNAFKKLVSSKGVPAFDSMGFTQQLVKMFITYKKKIIIARSGTIWETFVESLKDYDYRYKLSSNQNTSITPNNCCTNMGDKEGVFDSIFSALHEINSK